MVFDVITRLTEILTAASLPPALRPLAVAYPARQIKGRELQDGTVEVTVHHRYKKHGAPRPIDPEAIRAALNTMLPDDHRVTAVRTAKTHILITIRRDA